MLVMAVAGAAEGDWLLADRQTAGRGRMGRVWASAFGNLYATGLVHLRPTDPDPATLALVAAVVLYDTVALWVEGSALQLKWPNDLIVGGAKLSGILLERAGNAVVIGVGVNLAHHPKGLYRPVTSFDAMGIVPPQPAVFLSKLADIFNRWLGIWRAEGLNVIRTAWLTRAHPIGTALAVSLTVGDRIDGLFDGLTEDCALRLRLADGAVRVIHAGDVFLI